jgi:prepilin-type N-terminal cleavage/methylation domain-containing protein
MNKVRTDALKKGFTLIEIMVAVSIIAILSAIGFAAYNQTRAVARDGKRLSDAQEVQKALEQYYAVNSRYPTEAEVGADGGVLKSYFSSGTFPVDPQTGNNEASGYWSRGTCSNKYVFCIKLENCGSKCTLPDPLSTSLDPNSCSPGTAASGNIHYCVGALSN